MSDQWQHSAYFGDIKLPVAIGVKDILFRRSAKTALKGRTVSFVDRMMDYMDGGVFLCKLICQFSRSVRT
jgi:hypothetical protein